MTCRLLDVNAGARVRIVALGERAEDSLARLGFIPGAEAVVLSSSRVGVTVRVGGVKYALCRALAAEVEVGT